MQGHRGASAKKGVGPHAPLKPITASNSRERGAAADADIWVRQRRAAPREHTRRRRRVTVGGARGWVKPLTPLPITQAALPPMLDRKGGMPTPTPSAATLAATAARTRMNAYRAPAPVKNEVDRSLFGETAAAKAFKAKTYSDGVTYAPAAAAASSRRAAEEAAGSAPLLLSAGQLAAMARAATLGDGEAQRARAAAAAAAAERTAVAEARKERIRALEGERLKAVPLSQLQQEEEDEKARRRLLAAALREEATDDMKMMNSILNSAITVALRDRQLEERQAKAAADRDAERMRELDAEVRVLREQQRADAEAAAARAKVQLQQRELAEQLGDAVGRKAAAAAREAREGAAQKARMAAALAAEEAGKAAAKAKRAEQVKDFAKYNDEAVLARKARREAELAADARADAEALALAAKKAALLEEEEAKRKEKERLLHLAAANVTKILDNRAQVDELRARRAQERDAREARARELARERAAAAAQAELAATRAGMLEAKQALMASMIEEEKEEFDRAGRAQDEWLAAEREKDGARAAKNAALLRDLSAQVREREAAVRERRAREAKEEDERQAAVAAQSAFLRSIRDKKVLELKGLGVDPRWATALQSYDSDKVMAHKEMSGVRCVARGSGGPPPHSPPTLSPPPTHIFQPPLATPPQTPQRPPLERSTLEPGKPGFKLR
jgi:hypothetical protein